MERRPIKSRDAAPIRWLASLLASTSITANQISAASIGFAVFGSALLLMYVSSVTLVIMAVCIQLRLLCNVVDGLVAIEGGKQSPLGALFNEIPDRLCDVIFIVSIGYAVGLPTLGWIAALLAVGTAYLRLLGGALNMPQDFSGPLAKAHRMFALTVGCLLSAFEWWVTGTTYLLYLTFILMTLGTLATCVNRVMHLMADLNGGDLSYESGASSVDVEDEEDDE
jgi:phosphatidylglycerophosphate synthase